MIDGFQDLEALDLTTPVVACLARDGHMIGVVKAVEEGARMVSYKDRTLVRISPRALRFPDLV